MRNRAMTSPGDDFTFGSGRTRFMVDTPAAVAQAILTRMRLFVGEWFLDTREGLDKARILGYGTQGTRDLAIKQRIRGTPGVRRIVSYSSSVDERRNFSVSALVDTIYGQVTIEAQF